MNGHTAAMKSALKITVLLCGLGLFQNCTFQQTEDKKPENTNLDSIKIAEHIHAGYEILYLVKGNLNFDNSDDLIVVLDSVGERNIKENPPHRPLLIFLGTPNENYEKVLEHNNAILTHNMAGTSVNDPLHSIQIDSGTFKISHEGGFGRFRWKKAATFDRKAALLS